MEAKLPTSLLRLVCLVDTHLGKTFLSPDFRLLAHVRIMNGSLVSTSNAISNPSGNDYREIYIQPEAMLDIRIQVL